MGHAELQIFFGPADSTHSQRMLLPTQGEAEAARKKKKKKPKEAMFGGSLLGLEFLNSSLTEAGTSPSKKKGRKYVFGELHLCKTDRLEKVET